MSRTKTSFPLRRFFERFRTVHPDSELAFKQHTDIVKAISDVIHTTALLEGRAKFPNRMGVIDIRRIPHKENSRTPIDFNKSKKAGKTIYHMNDHTDGMLCKIIWNRDNTILYDKYKWFFLPVRAFKRQIPEMIKTEGIVYPILIK